MSVVSVSVAATGAPTFSPASVFSATLRVTGAMSLNTGAALTATVSEVTAKTGERP